MFNQGFYFDKLFANCYPMLAWFTFSMIAIAIMSAEFSSQLITKLSLKLSKESATDVQDLINSQKKILFPEVLSSELEHNALLNDLSNKAIKDDTSNLEITELFTNDKIINLVAKGEAALVLFEVPFKSLLFLFKPEMESHPKFICLKQWSKNWIIVLALNRNLNNTFRENLKFRYK